jgi:hypothetical protein
VTDFSTLPGDTGFAQLSVCGLARTAGGQRQECAFDGDSDAAALQ